MVYLFQLILLTLTCVGVIELPANSSDSAELSSLAKLDTVAVSEANVAPKHPQVEHFYIKYDSNIGRIVYSSLSLYFIHLDSLSFGNQIFSVATPITGPPCS